MMSPLADDGFELRRTDGQPVSILDAEFADLMWDTGGRQRWIDAVKRYWAYGELP